MQSLGLAVQMLKAPQKLPSAEAAAAHSMPEAQMAGRRLALAERLLSQHAPLKLLPFMFGHGRAAAACELLFPPARSPAAVNGSLGAEHDGSGGPVTARQGLHSQQLATHGLRNVHILKATAWWWWMASHCGCSVHRYGSMDDLVELCCTHGELRTLQRTLAAGGPRSALDSSQSLHKHPRSACMLDWHI